MSAFLLIFSEINCSAAHSPPVLITSDEDRNNVDSDQEVERTLIEASVGPVVSVEDQVKIENPQDVPIIVIDVESSGETKSSSPLNHLTDGGSSVTETSLPIKDSQSCDLTRSNGCGTDDIFVPIELPNQNICSISLTPSNYDTHECKDIDSSNIDNRTTVCSICSNTTTISTITSTSECPTSIEPQCRPGKRRTFCCTDAAKTTLCERSLSYGDLSPGPSFTANRTRRYGVVAVLNVGCPDGSLSGGESTLSSFVSLSSVTTDSATRDDCSLGSYIIISSSGNEDEDGVNSGQV